MISVIFFLFWIAYATLMSLAIDIPYLIPVWIISGFLVALIAVVLFIALNIYIWFPLTKFDNKFKYYTTRSIAIFLNIFVLRIKLRVKGREHIPDTGRLTTYSNHKSYADPIIIEHVIKRASTYTPKTGVYKLPVVKTWLKSIGAFPIDRESHRNTARAMVDAIKVVKSGMNMVIFPEGGIKDRKDNRMVEMRAGAYKVAMKAKADLLPITLINTPEIKHRAPWRRTVVDVIVHPVVTYDTVKDMTTNEIAEYIFNIINEPFTNM